MNDLAKLTVHSENAQFIIKDIVDSILNKLISLFNLDNTFRESYDKLYYTKRKEIDKLDLSYNKLLSKYTRQRQNELLDAFENARSQIFDDTKEIWSK